MQAHGRRVHADPELDGELSERRPIDHDSCEQLSVVRLELPQVRSDAVTAELLDTIVQGDVGKLQRSRDARSAEFIREDVARDLE